LGISFCVQQFHPFKYKQHTEQCKKHHCKKGNTNNSDTAYNNSCYILALRAQFTILNDNPTYQNTVVLKFGDKGAVPLLGHFLWILSIVYV